MGAPQSKVDFGCRSILPRLDSYQKLGSTHVPELGRSSQCEGFPALQPTSLLVLDCSVSNLAFTLTVLTEHTLVQL
jgi:hypothetical protein